MLKVNAKVLIVDDEPLIRLMLADALEDAGYSVLEAGSVLEAVGLLGAHGDISAVVTDINMPGGLSGIDLARLLTTFQSYITTVVTSGGYRPLPIELPAGTRFFAKPYDLQDIVAAIESDRVPSQARSARQRNGLS